MVESTSTRISTDTRGQAALTAGMPSEVEATFNDWDEPMRGELLLLRDLILATAAETDGVGAITETLKWGEPAYLTSETRSGSTIRLAPTNAKSTHDYAMFFICSTNLVSDFRAQFGDTFTYEGDRAVLFTVGDTLPINELRECVRMALTYHQRSAGGR
ncbi:hypothetical protein A20C1_11526 [marine actinobacterium PHSC20C1]|nr:hypothetical protein A20C1_11526 [marine actinobacterium PHSC20C1]